ncbi:MAG: YbhB/YbcL family Raf kinase inhibitor-like protein [Anaerolineae bacterium]|nr:YbhB/YbcL family Raf kinase inhibitor-like protein [Thermoflexus sp.]MDW8065669.1 YbhB/YbcL family Raf kinase inhibitor-like protein [Anaerolineae bacterium]
MCSRIVSAGFIGLLMLGLGCGVTPPAAPTETPGLVQTTPVPTSPPIPTPTPAPTETPSSLPLPTPTPSPVSEGGPSDLNLRSPAFAEGEIIPREYTCDGADRSPPLRWDPSPPGTQSLVLIMDDPDAPRGRFVHWVLYAIPPDRTELTEGLPPQPSIEGVGRQGRNDFGRLGYGGPCPPSGPAHRYQFTLYALDVALELPPGARHGEVEAALSGHVLAVGRLTGRYGR